MIIADKNTGGDVIGVVCLDLAQPWKNCSEQIITRSSLYIL